MVKDKSFREKKEVYRNHIQLRMVQELLDLPDWDANALEERERRLVAWAREEWTLPRDSELREPVPLVT
jgi:hypothetical protein